MSREQSASPAGSRDPELGTRGSGLGTRDSGVLSVLNLRVASDPPRGSVTEFARARPALEMTLDIGARIGFV
jgi:hypothetical protein